MVKDCEQIIEPATRMGGMDPAPILLKFLEVDAIGIPQDSLQNALLYIEHGEFGVAYDLIVYHILNGEVALTDEGWSELRRHWLRWVLNIRT